MAEELMKRRQESMIMSIITIMIMTMTSAIAAAMTTIMSITTMTMTATVAAMIMTTSIITIMTTMMTAIVAVMITIMSIIIIMTMMTSAGGCMTMTTTMITTMDTIMQMMSPFTKLGHGECRRDEERRSAGFWMIWLMGDKYGQVLRAKGMVPSEEKGVWLHFDMVPEG